MVDRRRATPSSQKRSGGVVRVREPQRSPRRNGRSPAGTPWPRTPGRARSWRRPVVPHRRPCRRGQNTALPHRPGHRAVARDRPRRRSTCLGHRGDHLRTVPAASARAPRARRRRPSPAPDAVATAATRIAPSGCGRSLDGPAPSSRPAPPRRRRAPAPAPPPRKASRLRPLRRPRPDRDDPLRQRGSVLIRRGALTPRRPGSPGGSRLPSA